MLLEARRTLGPLPGSLGSLNCSLTCASPCALSCPFSGTYPCSRGGSITNTSTITGQVEPDLTGDADIVGKQTYADCSPEQSLVINGDPYTTLNGKLKFKTAQLYGNQTGHIGGAVKYVSGNLSGSCPIDVNLTYSTITSKATVTGTACGAPVNMTY
jgi:hypothetical protein